MILLLRESSTNCKSFQDSNLETTSDEILTSCFESGAAMSSMLNACVVVYMGCCKNQQRWTWWWAKCREFWAIILSEWPHGKIRTLNFGILTELSTNIKDTFKLCLLTLDFLKTMYLQKKQKILLRKLQSYIYIYFLYILIYIFIHVWIYTYIHIYYICIYIERKRYHASSLHFLHRRTLESRERTWNLIMQ